MVVTAGIEPATFPMSREHSTAELSDPPIVCRQPFTGPAARTVVYPLGPPLASAQTYCGTGTELYNLRP